MTLLTRKLNLVLAVVDERFSSLEIPKLAFLFQEI